ncbi:MAG: (2Fe-2S) ferredoxin domain-containing protein [Oscillospiraceae bacterium]|jgi:NADP-reducing hydrogenase subunit HndB|nr:(2Fe-2S) ferredoxin domain-containing protein [Oscillospiraceae bacterium]
MKSLAELKAIKDKMQGQVTMRNHDEAELRVVVGMATCGIAAGARPVLQTLSALVQEKNLQGVTVTQTGCIGLCQFEPIVEVHGANGEKVTYINMNEEKAREIVDKHLVRGQVVAEYIVGSSGI